MIKPIGSSITIASGMNTYTLFVDSIDTTFTSEFFDRPEFSNDRLRQAKYSDGALPLIVTLFGGIPIQVLTTCGGSRTPRVLVPDDANVDTIKKRFDIKRYTMKGLASIASTVDSVYTISQAHKILLDRFQAHQNQVGMDISDTALLALRSETFSYLTSTSISLSGNPIATTETNVLIRSFDMDVEFEIPGDDDDDSSTLYKGWNAVIDILTIKNAEATS